MFGAVKLTKNADPDKYKYSAYDIGFDSLSQYAFTDGSMGKIVVFGADMSSYVYVVNKGKDILILGEGPTQGLDYTILTLEAKYSINFTQSNRKLYTIMEATVFYLLMLQKYISSKQMILK